MSKLSEYMHSTFSSLKVRNYQLYYIGQGISLSGTWMQTIAQAWLVLQLTHSGVALGITVALQFLPILIFGMYGGVLADKYDRRTLLYITNTAAMLLALILGVLVLTNTVQLWMVYVLAFGLGLVNAVDNPTRQSFVMEMVGKENISNAVTLNSAQINIARVVGPSIGGALIAFVGLAACFIINGFTFIAVIYSLWLMRKNELHNAPKPKGKVSLREGLNTMWTTPELRTTIVMAAIMGTLAYEFTVSLPIIAEFTFHGDATTYAAFTAAMGLGSVIGGLFVASRKNIEAHMLMPAALLLGVSIFLAAAMPTLNLMLLALVLVGAFSINFVSVGMVTLQLKSPPQMRSRIMSLWTIAILGTTPIGGPIVGWIGEKIDPRMGLGIGGFACLFAAGICWLMLRSDKKKRKQLLITAIGNESE